MEIVVGLIVVLAVAAFLGRDTRPAMRPVDVPALPPAPRTVLPQDRADVAFVLGYLAGRHSAEAPEEQWNTRHQPDGDYEELIAYDDCDNWEDA